MTLDDLPECISVPDLASYLGISRSGAYNLCRSGQIPSIRIGGSVRVRKSVFLEWIAAQEKKIS